MPQLLIIATIASLVFAVIRFFVGYKSIPAYLAMAFFTKLGKGMDVMWPTLVMMMRAGNLIMYLLLMFLAIKVAANGKFLLMLIGLFPQNIFMASTVSYDPFIIGSMSLGLAFMSAYEENADRPNAKKSDILYIILAMVFVLLACLPKAVYAPMIFLFPAFMTKRTKKEKNVIIISCIIVNSLNQILTSTMFWSKYDH